MKNHIYKNLLINKKQLKHLLGWSFTKYDSMQACYLADELKYLGFKYASQAGLSISLEDLKIPFIKDSMLQMAQKDIINYEKIYLKGKITSVERFQKIINIWSIISESLKEEIISYFKNYDPLNSVYIMAFSGARGNLSQVRQLVGMRGLMSDPNGEIIKLPIKKNFREGLTITDYLISGYGARKGIIDTALKTANSGYLTRRLIDVAQDILIREKDCLTPYSYLIYNFTQSLRNFKILGRVTSKPIHDLKTNNLIINSDTQINTNIISIIKQSFPSLFYIRSPLTCSLYRSVCQMCYGWDLAQENLVDIGEAVGIIAGQSIGEPGTQLTMRTFHTGGIFTSEIREKIKSPITGIIKFSKTLKKINIRTSEGVNVLLIKNSGSFIIVPELKNLNPIKIGLLRNTILFIKNHQYIKKNSIIGELVDDKKQIKNEIKTILANTSGEIFIPLLKNINKSTNKNKLLWILSGKVFQSPSHVFLNFSNDFKIFKNSYIFRTKFLNFHSGFIQFINNKKNLFQRILQVCTSNRQYLLNTNVQKIKRRINKKNYLLTYDSKKYIIDLEVISSKLLSNIQINSQFGISLSNNFKTLVGGRMFYDQRVKNSNQVIIKSVCYFRPYTNLTELKNLKKGWDLIKNKNKKFINKPSKFKKKILLFKINKKILVQLLLLFEILSSISVIKKLFYRSIIWLEEETYKLNCNYKIVLAKHGSFISKNFEIILGTFSKTSGIVSIYNNGNLVKEISIKSGYVYKGKQFEQFNKKIFYPGEILLNNIIITYPSLCEYIEGKSIQQLLIRPLKIFETPIYKSMKKFFVKNIKLNSKINLENKIYYLYKSNQKIKTAKSIDLFVNTFAFKVNKFSKINRELQLLNNKKRNLLNLKIFEYLYLNNYISAQLRYTNIESCLLINSSQFIDSYTILGYFESVNFSSLEIVKLKSNHSKTKQICLISNENCLVVKKSKFDNKIINNLIINNNNVELTGKILIKNNNFITIQKGRPYFFPNCKNENEELQDKNSIEYKLIYLDNFKDITKLTIKKNIYLNYFDVTKNLINKKCKTNEKIAKFSKTLILKNKKLYSCIALGVIKRFQIKKDESKFLDYSFFIYKNKKNVLVDKKKSKKLKKFLNSNLSLFVKDQISYSNSLKNDMNHNLSLIKFITPKLCKNIGIHSITDDYLEQEVNTVFCKNGEFIENGQTIGLLNFEKKITGDIVQGLPRIEQLLEARKKKQTSKYSSLTKKKNLLIQTTSIDSYFEFRKLGNTIKENERINPHKLLKVFFNYYRIPKHFFCDRTLIVDTYQLSNNYEASYRSFKKVQALILNAVQSVYKSQGVSIADKHLEVIIKQMTTKVLITHQGNTSLLPREVIDIYHIEYINKIVKLYKSQTALYVPLLLGITKAALNNPSFISAASFQETTRVLTKAAIDGRFDWLRGLKENIITGHLIPAGTGSHNYIMCFKK